jgi:predicted AlkP superfamily phosphohydrolase/phosphomutase
MFSGVNPGEHGVFGFGEPADDSYRVTPVDASCFRAPRIWELMSQKNRPSVVLNVPLTYPARPLVGSMVSGFVAPSLERAVYPPGLLPQLRQAGYRPEADMDLGLADPQALIDDLGQVIAARLRLFEQMLESDWELYLAVVTDTDRINHFFWQAMHTKGHPLKGPALGLFRQIDGFLGKVLQYTKAALQAKTVSLLIAADHSFGPIDFELYLNRWLIGQGYLEILLEEGSEQILPQTKALALDPGRIYLHRSGRFSSGKAAEPSKWLEIKEQMVGELMNIKHPDTGKPCIARVHRKEELYQGPYLDNAPDLVLEAMPGVSLRAGLAKPQVFGHSHLSGTHRPEGALALWLGGPLDTPPGHIQGLHRIMLDALDLQPKSGS